MQSPDRYYIDLMRAFVRGRIIQGRAQSDLTLELVDTLLPDELYQKASEAGLKVHKFKRNISLPRIQKVIGTLKGIQPTELLDIGSGRGTFLWPMLDESPLLSVTSVDHSEVRSQDIEAVHLGGVEKLLAHRMDVRHLEFSNSQFDVVTFLEVLEHIEDPEVALAEVIRVARRFVLLSVPSKPDDNPEHLHLFSQKSLTGMLEELGITSVTFDYVPGHIIAVIRLKGCKGER